jgi:hypothetical protein
MDASTISRATMSSALWFATAYGLSSLLGADIPLYAIVMDSAIMGGSALASDTLHNALGKVPTPASSALSTGAIYSGVQYATKGDNSFVVNTLFAGANDMAVEVVASSVSVA